VGGVDGIDYPVDVRAHALEQVAASLPAREQRSRVLDLHVGREDEDRDLGHLIANRLRRPETFGGMVGRHTDVDDGNVGSMLADETEELCRVAGLSDDAVTGLREQAGDAFAEQEVVVGDDNGPLYNRYRLTFHSGP